MNYVKKTDFFDVYIEPNRSTIVVRSKWKYVWSGFSKEYSWSYQDKKNWHHKADTIIWNTWGSKYTLWALVEKETLANKNLHKKEFNVEFDVEWVTQNPHFTVHVIKLPPDEWFRSHVNYTDKKIMLADRDIKQHEVKKGIPFCTLPHEFGHVILADDEYGKKYGNSHDPVNVNDTKAMMNVGSELRRRYIRDVNKIANTMVDGVLFHAFLDKK